MRQGKGFMKDGVNSGGRQRVIFFGTFGGYAVQGLKDLNECEKVGWYVMSWPRTDPVHDFWISGTTFYRVRAETFEIVENIDPAERSAVLEAIQAWEKELKQQRLAEVQEKIDRGIDQLDRGLGVPGPEARARLRRIRSLEWRI